VINSNTLHRNGLKALAITALLSTGCGDDKEDEAENQNPVAEAGANQLLATNAPVLLSASGSFDPDGDPISYHWAFDATPSGSALANDADVFFGNDGNDPATRFTPDTEGTYIVSLIVTDALGGVSSPDLLTVTISAGEAPVAEAGADQTGAVGVSVALDGSASSDKRDRDLSYAWSFAQIPPHSSLSALTDPTSGTPSFTPDVSGMYLVALVVNNGLEDSSPDTTVLRVVASDSDAPVANAGADIDAEDCTQVLLDGSESFDPNDEVLTYLWDLESRPAGSASTVDTFSDPEGVTSHFYPDVDGEYIISLAVHDGSGWSTPDALVLTASERDYNTPPAVNPGVPHTFEGGEAICEATAYSYICGYCEAQTVLIGTDALINDPDNDTITYSWAAESSGAAIHSPNSLETSVVLSGAQPTAPDECEETEYRFRLTAEDCTGATSSQAVTHTITCCGYTLEDEPL
jgi:hypothetical protein